MSSDNAISRLNSILLKKEAKCWEGYERVPGTKPMTPGSCRPTGGKKDTKEKSEKKGYSAKQSAEKCECCGKSPCACPPNCSCGCKHKSAAAKPGLWANIHAKKERGEAPAKPGSEDYPTAKNWKKVTSISEKKAAPAWQTSEGKSESGGLNDKGRASLKAQGHDIKRPQPEGGPRKDSFCARMKGMKAKLTSSETANDPDSRINKSLRKWKCGSAAEKLASLLPMSTGFKFPSMPQPKPESWKSQAAGWGGQRAGKQYGAQLGNMAGGMANTLGKPLGVTPGQANQFGQAVGNFASPILGNIGSFVGSNAQRYNIPIPGMPSLLR
jgi:hypothetical protein